jgi:hypothetical protein
LRPRRRTCCATWLPSVFPILLGPRLLENLKEKNDELYEACTFTLPEASNDCMFCSKDQSCNRTSRRTTTEEHLARVLTYASAISRASRRACSDATGLVVCHRLRRARARTSKGRYHFVAGCGKMDTANRRLLDEKNRKAATSASRPEFSGGWLTGPLLLMIDIGTANKCNRLFSSTNRMSSPRPRDDRTPLSPSKQ